VKGLKETETIAEKPYLEHGGDTRSAGNESYVVEVLDDWLVLLAGSHREVAVPQVDNQPVGPSNVDGVALDSTE